ncbi:MAG: metallophosphoesterase [Lachnospiraceae bacterium]|nr:metallophosphoesterase [Lachnospiraceae bacterium]
MIYITGDCHAEFHKLNKENFPEQMEMTKADYVIICGDFGGVWDAGKESKNEKWWMNWLEERPFTTLFVDGNHENFDRLNSYPVEEWHGGKVHKIRPSVIHLMRGQVYELEGKKIFTFGGAQSHDIRDGILEPDDPNYKTKKKWMDTHNKLYRVNHISWWAQELASVAEIEEARQNLELRNWQVDFIVTHCCPVSTQAMLGMHDADVTTAFLEEIKCKCDYKYWFFGHYHDNKNVTYRDLLLYEQIIRIC